MRLTNYDLKQVIFVKLAQVNRTSNYAIRQHYISFRSLNISYVFSWKNVFKH